MEIGEIKAILVKNRDAFAVEIKVSTIELEDTLDRAERRRLTRWIRECIMRREVIEYVLILLGKPEVGL